MASATYVADAQGMGVILVLSVASALAHSTVANHMRRLSPVAPRIGGALMIIAGGYAIWYGRWELDVYAGDIGTDPVVDTPTRTNEPTVPITADPSTNRKQHSESTS